jgi:hypothetical protein
MIIMIKLIDKEIFYHHRLIYCYLFCERNEKPKKTISIINFHCCFQAITRKMESGGGLKSINSDLSISANKYELKLYNLFKNHDQKSVGSLDKDALLKLCTTLDLKERGESLVRCLIKKGHKRVTFQEFREGLLNILAEDTANVAGESQFITNIRCHVITFQIIAFLLYFNRQIWIENIITH